MGWALEVRSLGNVAKRWVFDATASISKTGDRSVVGPALELLLHSLRQDRSIDIRILGSFLGEFSVKVGRITGVQLW